MDNRAAKSEPLVSEDFDKDLSRWSVERDPEAFTYEIADGRLHVKTVKTKRSEGGFIWLKQELPADFRVEFDVTPVSKSGFFLIFFCAKSLDERDMLDHPPIEDSWGQYWQKYTAKGREGEIASYHISYRRNRAENCNLRKNPGLNMARQTDSVPFLETGKTHHVVLTRKADRITLDVDAVRYMDWTDDGKKLGKPHGGGRFGFRQVYDSEGYYDNFRAYALEAVTP